MSPRTLSVAALGLGLLTAALGIAFLHVHGPTWDEAAGDLLYGERSLAFLLTGDARHLDLYAHMPLLVEDAVHPDFFASRKLPAHELFPFASLLSAASCLLLFQLSGLMDAVDAHHLPVPLLASAFVACLFLWVARRWGTLVAALTAAFLLLNPRFAGEAVANLKDTPETCMFGFCVLWAARDGATFRSRLLGSAVFAGLALASKPNALFLPLLLVPYALARGGLPSGRRAAAALLFVPLMAAAALAVWPYLWSAPFEHGAKVVGYIQSRKTVPSGFRLDTLRELVLTLPEPLLVLVPLGVAAVLRAGRRRADVLLLLLWFVVPLLRHVFLGVPSYDGIRHFLEAFPAMATLAALGAAALVSWLQTRRKFVAPLLVAALLAPLLLALIRHYPLWNTYYNSLVGGLAGARARGFPAATDYWAASYRDGIARVNDRAPPGARLVVPVADHAVRCVRDVWLRKDVALVEPPELVFGDETGSALVMFVHRPDFFEAVAWYCERNVAPAEALLVAGVPVRKTFVLEPPQRAALRRLGDHWRAAAEQLDRDAPRGSVVVTADWEAAPERGPRRADLRCVALHEVGALLSEDPDLIRKVEVFCIAAAVVASRRQTLLALGLTPHLGFGDGDEAVDVWRIPR